MKNIAVIGAGTMGNGIAHTFAQKGFKVFLIDISEKSIEMGMNTILKNLDRMIAKGAITEADKKATIENIITYNDIKDGVINADLVGEAATENSTLKLNIFKELKANQFHNFLSQFFNCFLSKCYISTLFNIRHHHNTSLTKQCNLIA